LDTEQNIFISIAAYRDPELLPTLRDCLAKARFPDRLRFGICWQHEDNEPRPDLFDDERFQVLPVHWRQSKGACWARASLMQLWRGEPWFMQLDSHHRFARDWDVKLHAEAAATGSAKFVLTTYAAPFTPGDEDAMDDQPMVMNFDRFIDSGIVIFRPGGIPEGRSLAAPVRARFISGHFLFAPGRFVRDVPYDPELYFLGEEITLSVRAFTHGYDLFHPSQAIVWHEYTRNYRTKHWDDHTEKNGITDGWAQRDQHSRSKIDRFLRNPHIGEFGCGTARSFAEYEEYAGLDFRLCRAQEYTRSHLEPPNPPAQPGWAEAIRDFHVRIAVDVELLETAAVDDPQFWYVGIHDATGREMFRQDCDEEQLAELLAGAPATVSLVRDIESVVEPAAWVIWPCSKSKGWLEKLTGPLSSDSADPATFRGACGWTSLEDVEAIATRVYPRVEPGLAWVPGEDGFNLVRRGQPKCRHAINHTGMLLLEFSNGANSLAEICQLVREAYGLTELPYSEIRQFFEHASHEGLDRIKRTSYQGEENGNRHGLGAIQENITSGVEPGSRVEAAIH
jgi:hypothetical protein